ncbi:MAG: hypothetical protein Q9173_000594 [Seirophora scorigena]
MDMSDPRLFAVLTPCDNSNLAREAFSLPENNHYYHKAAHSIAQEPIIDSRESTPAHQQPTQTYYGSGDCILLHFDDPLKEPMTGWQFGTNPRLSDILLGHRGTMGISSRQFYITITDQYRVELHDGSRYGTFVSHEGQGKDVVLKHDKRLLTLEPGADDEWEDIQIYIPDEKGLVFQIEFPNHRAAGPDYWKNLPVNLAPLELFPSGTTVGRLDEAHMDKSTRSSKCGKDSSTSPKSSTPKAPTRPRGKKRKLDEAGWLDGIRNEVDNMKNHPHPNIMQLIEFPEEPEPLLLMPYYPHGSLEDLAGVESWQYVSASRQMLLGLRHLHGRGVVHRDLKPGNLLVADRDPLTIVISDFGFSKVATTSDLLTTFCGSKLYAAPEVVPVGKHQSKGYDASVDIWSAGIIMLVFVFGKPDDTTIDHLPLGKWIWAWSDIAIKQVYELDVNSDQVIDLVKHMVVKIPEDRFSADQCLQKGCDNGLFKRRGDDEIIDADGPSCYNNIEAEIDAAAPDADSSDNIDLDDDGPDGGAATPRPLPRSSESGESSVTPAILAGELWRSTVS